MRGGFLGSVLAVVLVVAACSAPPEARTVALPQPPARVVAATPPPAPLDLSCAGAFAQGGVVLCKTTPGAILAVDGEDRGAADAAGWVVAGFDRDAGPSTTFSVRTATGTKTADFTVAARSYSVQRVNGLPQETVSPSDPAVLKRIAEEGAAKEEARKSRAPAEGFLQGFIWPIQGIMSGAWGNQRVLNGVPKSPHFGFDIAAPEGAPILAAADGVIAMANPDMHFEGGLVMIDHGQGLITYYLHMSRLDVAAGQTVRQGDVIGAVGKKGRATGPHLCWRMRWRDRNLDPSLAVQALSTARATFANGAPLEPGAAPPNFTPWSPAASVAPAPTQ
jgi:murein DD-endopeptidase MepM/ murein hydrolase activator NlpD